MDEMPEWTTRFVKTPLPGEKSDPHRNRTDGGRFSGRMVTMSHEASFQPLF